MNEFKIKNGFFSEGSSNITGSLTVTGGITGSLQGTASFATTASDATSIASAITNNGDNYLLTATGTGTIEGESLLTFDGATLTAQSSFSQGGGKANGQYSHAEGSSEANGDYSHAEGYVTFAGSSQGYKADSITNGTCSLEISYGDLSAEYTAGDQVLFDDTAHAAAYGTQIFTVASSSYLGSITQVYFTDATINSSEAVIGNLTTGVLLWGGGYRIGGHYSHAEGDSTYALGQYSHAEGERPQAIGNYSHAEGVDTRAFGVGSHAEGLNTTTIGRRSHAEGAFTTASGEASHAEGYLTTAQGDYSHAEGYNTTALGSYSHAEGSGSIASGSNSHAEGYLTTAIRSGSHAEGYGTYALGDHSHAEGVGTQAISTGSHAEGKETVAAGPGSHAEGDRTRAGGGLGYLTSLVGGGTCSLDASYGNVTSSFSVGTTVVLDDTGYSGTYGVRILTVATVGLGTPSGPTQLSFTDTTINTTTAIIGNLSSNLTTGNYPVGGNYSHAEGGATRALGGYSHAEGIGTYALGAGQHVSGRNNTLTDSTSLFIVGNGVDGANRSDAFKVRQSGSIVLPTTSSNAPGWTGTDGEMIFGQTGGNYKMYVWLGGAWRSGSLT